MMPSNACQNHTRTTAIGAERIPCGAYGSHCITMRKERWHSQLKQIQVDSVSNIYLNLEVLFKAAVEVSGLFMSILH